MLVNKEKKGLVTKKFNEFYHVDLIENDGFIHVRRFLCVSRKSVHYKNQLIYVGDVVIISQLNLDDNTAIIEKLIKRKNLLQRPAVANISDIYVTCSVKEPEINFSQVNKFLINAEYLNVDVSLVLTKCDLIKDAECTRLIEKFQKWGYSPKTLNLDDSFHFENFMRGLKMKQCSILIGPSGVGKTSLLNRMMPGLDNPTASVSQKIKRGKNTTRNVELFSLSKNSYVVDTPGFNIQNMLFAPRLIQFYFPEITKQHREKNLCKYRNCLHLSEPGCMLNKSFERYKFYRDLVEMSKNHYSQIQED